MSKRIKVVALHVMYSYFYLETNDTLYCDSAVLVCPKQLVKDALTIGTDHETEKAKEMHESMEGDLKRDLTQSKRYFRDLHISGVEKVGLEGRPLQLLRKAG